MYSDDIYTLLRISREATEETVKKTFRQFARQNHPDLHPGDGAREARFKQVTAAYQNWKVIRATVEQIRRLKRAAGASAGSAGFTAWDMGPAFGAGARAKFRPWRLDIWA
jgi:molecular chaperone DnaJ